MTTQSVETEEALAQAEDLVQRLELEARRFVARAVEFAEDVWAEAQSVRQSESRD
jgi:hypothetical protein